MHGAVDGSSTLVLEVRVVRYRPQMTHASSSWSDKEPVLLEVAWSSFCNGVLIENHGKPAERVSLASASIEPENLQGDVPFAHNPFCNRRDIN